jgi:hypothetical protein
VFLIILLAFSSIVSVQQGRVTASSSSIQSATKELTGAEKKGLQKLMNTALLREQNGLRKKLKEAGCVYTGAVTYAANEACDPDKATSSVKKKQLTEGRATLFDVMYHGSTGRCGINKEDNKKGTYGEFECSGITWSTQKKTVSSDKQVQKKGNTEKTVIPIPTSDIDALEKTLQQTEETLRKVLREKEDAEIRKVKPSELNNQNILVFERPRVKDNIVLLVVKEKNDPMCWLCWKLQFPIRPNPFVFSRFHAKRTLPADVTDAQVLATIQRETNAFHYKRGVYAVHDIEVQKCTRDGLDGWCVYSLYDLRPAGGRDVFLTLGRALLLTMAVLKLTIAAKKAKVDWKSIGLLTKRAGELTKGITNVAKKIPGVARKVWENLDQRQLIAEVSGTVGQTSLSIGTIFWFQEDLNILREVFYTRAPSTAKNSTTVR